VGADSLGRVDTPTDLRRSIASVARVFLVVYLIALGLIVWLPAAQASTVTGIVVDIARLIERVGIPFALGYPAMEFLANIALFAPFGALVTLARPRLRWWHVVLLGFATSAVIELVQLNLSTRFSTVSDLVANTAGAFAGWVIAAALDRTLIVFGLTDRIDRSPADATPGVR
jgi:glycopeptide antibiotics resistance protein